MLLGEDLGGRHHRHLPAVLDGLQCGERGHDRLAAADVALQQPLHRVRPREVGSDFRQHPRLRAREPERQRGQQTARQLTAGGQARVRARSGAAR